MKLFLTLLMVFLTLPTLAQAQLNIVATTPALAQIAQAVCGEDGHVYSLAKIGQDPHFVPPKPTLARHLADADLLFTVGLGLESGWLPPLMNLSRNQQIHDGGQGHFAGADFITVIGAGAKVNRSMGDVHPEGNPHWWLDPMRVAVVAQHLATRLAILDPDHAEAYAKRASLFANKLQQFVVQWQATLQEPYAIVTYHDSYRYLVDLFSIQVLGFIEPKPGVEPSTRHLDALIRSMKVQGVHQIWAEPYHMGRIAQQVASLSKTKLLMMSDAIEGEAGAAYLRMIERILESAVAVEQ